MLQAMVNTHECMLFYVPRCRRSVRIRAARVPRQVQRPRAGGRRIVLLLSLVAAYKTAWSLKSALESSNCETCSSLSDTVVHLHVKLMFKELISIMNLGRKTPFS